MANSSNLAHLEHANALIRYGVDKTCPSASGILELSAARAQVSKKCGAPDVVSRAARCCYSFLSGQQKFASIDRCTDASDADGAVADARDCKRAKVEVTTVSEFGVTRTHAFPDADALAHALVRAFEAAPEELRRPFREFRVGHKSELLLLTWKFWETQQAAGYLLCPACGCFFGGERGLRTHQQIKHGSTYGVAKDVVTAAQQQLIVPQRPNWLPDGAWPHDPGKEGPGGAPPVAAGTCKTELLPAFRAARDGDLAALRRLVAQGWDPLEEDRHGSNALLWAAGGGHLDVCRFLVEECRVPVDVAATASGAGKRQLKRRRNALHWAARHGRLDVCKWLVAKGLDINSTTHDGTSAFHWAVWQGHMHVCTWMVYLGGCDFESTNSFGCNAIQWAAQTDDLAMCRWLAAIGLDVRVVNLNGHSALHKAASKGRRGVCAWLLNEECLGAEHMRADGDGNTPAVMARLEGFTDLAAELEEAGRVLAAGGGAAREGPFGRGDGGGAEGGGGPRGTEVRRDVGLCMRLARLRQLAAEDPDDDVHAPGPIHGHANRLPRSPPQHTSQEDASPPLPTDTAGDPTATRPTAATSSTPTATAGVLVSIVLPLYNAAEFLDECMQGIAAQTHRPLEVVAYDNRSTDGSAALLRQWVPRLEARGMRVVVVQTGAEDARGCGYARNRCVEAASGEWICSADADDIMLPRRVALQLAAARAAPPRTLLGCRFVRDPPDATWHYSLWANTTTQHDLWLQQFRECTIVQPTWFYRRSLWLDIGGFPVTPEPGLDPPGAQRALADDFRFMHAHLQRGGRLRRLDHTLVVYRHHGGQLSHETPAALIRAVRVRAVEARVLRAWPRFSVWGAGRDAKAFVGALSQDSRDKIRAFAEVDPRKVGKEFYSAAVDVCAPIVHVSEVRPPFVCCVARGRTGGDLEANVAAKGQEGVDYWFVA